MREGSGRPRRRGEFFRRGSGLGHRLGLSLIPCLALLLLRTAAVASGGAEAGGHEGLNWVNFFWRSVNFVVLAGALYWLLAKKTRDFFTGRQEKIRTSLREAKAAREAAERKFKEYAQKLDKATGEIEQITAMIRAQGLAEKERMIAEAGRAAEKMKADTRTRMEQEFKEASQQLRSETVELSVQMAEELLRRHVRLQDHEAMVEDYLAKVVNKH